MGMTIPNWILRASDGEYFAGFAAGGEISTVVKAEYAMSFMSFGTAQQYAHELTELTGDRWEVTQG